MLFSTDERAEWRRWFRVPRISLFHLAAQNRQRALLCHNASGVDQLYAWELGGALRPLTANVNGVRLGTISADGQTVYYLEDAQGGQIGHFFRVGFDGEDRRDLTPDWPAYTSFYVAECASGRFYGFMTYNQLGSQMFVVDAAAGGTPHLRYESEALSLGPYLSYDGELAVVMALDERGHTLESYDVRSGQRVAAIASPALIEPAGFAPRPHDMRFLATSFESGLRRPFWWNARTGERRDLTLSTESVIPLDWSSDAQQIVYTTYGLSGTRTAVTHLKTGETAPFDWLDQHSVEAAHWQSGALWTLAQQYHQPPTVRRGAQVVLQAADLADVPQLPRVTVSYRGLLAHYAQPSELHVVLLHVDEFAVPQRWLPMVNAWLSVGAAVSVWFSLVNHGVVSGAVSGRELVERDAAELRAALQQLEAPPRRLLIGRQLAALTAQTLPAAGRVLIDPPSGTQPAADSPTLILDADNAPPAPDRDEQIMARVLAWWEAVSATGAR
jgi:hypothetical protein